ncbi:50S ribosomal protein L29 [Candidatus Saccharibacteria bacterium]|nr:50S ribosomal protein L29 [Candidatus Saccharibacteria bacterium]
MAEKSTAVAAKKSAPKAEKTLHEQLAEKRADLLIYRKSLAANELVNPRAITTIKKDIARILTKLNAKGGK